MIHTDAPPPSVRAPLLSLFLAVATGVSVVAPAHAQVWDPVPGSDDPSEDVDAEEPPDATTTPPEPVVPPAVPDPFVLQQPPRRETLPGMYPEAISMFATQGISVATPDRRFTLRAGGFFHLDTRHAITDGTDDLRQDMYFRRVRLTFDGRLFGELEYRLLWDFAIDPLAPYDFHVDWRPRPEFNLRAGGFKSPFGFERRARAYALPFMERAWPTSLSSNRDIGLFAYGQAHDGFFSYDVMLGTGAEDLGVQYSIRGGPDFAGRVYFQPFRLGGPPELRHLGLGFSWTLGQEIGMADDPRLSRVRATNRRLLFEYLQGEDGTFAHGRRDRQSLHAFWRHGQVNALFEYTRSASQVGRGQREDGSPMERASLAHHAWQATVSMTMNPDDENTWFGVSPSRPLAPAKGQWGGYTVSLRYQELHMDRDAFPVFADPLVSAHTGRALGTSLQWHVNTNLELQADVERLLVWGGAPGGMPGETTFMTRLELRY